MIYLILVFGVIIICFIYLILLSASDIRRCREEEVQNELAEEVMRLRKVDIEIEELWEDED